MKIRIIILMAAIFPSCLLLTKKISINESLRKPKKENVLLLIDYRHEINGDPLEINQNEIDSVTEAIKIGLIRNNLIVEESNFNKIVEVQIGIHELKNKYFAKASTFTFGIIPHNMELELQYELALKTKDGKVLNIKEFNSKSSGFHSIILFPFSIFLNPKYVLENHLSDATELLIKSME